MAVGETPGQGCQSGSKSLLEFCHANMIHFVWIMVSDCRKRTGPPDAGNNLQKKRFHHVSCDKILHNSWSIAPTTILNEEKALGTRLVLLLLTWLNLVRNVVTSPNAIQWRHEILHQVVWARKEHVGTRLVPPLFLLESFPPSPYTLQSMARNWSQQETLAFLFSVFFVYR